MHQHKATRVMLTPSLLDNILGNPGLDLRRRLGALNTVFLQGEVVPSALCAPFARRMPAGARLVNAYSTWECTDVAYAAVAIGGGGGLSGGGGGSPAPFWRAAPAGRAWQKLPDTSSNALLPSFLELNCIL